MQGLQKSYEAYLSSFTSYLPLLTPILSTLSSTLPLFSTFARDEVKPLADVVQRLTTLGACDLMLGNKTSLAPAMRECGVPNEVAGAVIEWQAQCLEDGIWKADIKGVVSFLLGEARGAYGVERPIQVTRSVRSVVQGWGLIAWYRIIVKMLEIAYYDGDQTTAKALAAEVTKLITSKVGRFTSPFRVYAVLSNLVNSRTRKTFHLTIYAHNTESPCPFGKFFTLTNVLHPSRKY
jgi:hypothetical protein